MVVTILGTALAGVLFGTVLVSLIEWAWKIKAKWSTGESELIERGLFDASILDQRPEWGQPMSPGAVRQSLSGKKTMEARWGA